MYMNISEINKIEKIGSFNLLGENDLGKITPDNNKHLAVITYKNTYAGEKKVSHRSLIIYFICADKFIKKIGYTNSTLSSATSLYGLGAMTGEPGPNRFCLHLEMYKLLKQGKKIEMYARWFDEKFEANLDGVFVKDGKEKISSLLNAVDVENYVKNKFANSVELPEWNLQEQSDGYSPLAKKLYAAYNSLPKPRIGKEADELFEEIKNFHTS